MDTRSRVLHASVRAGMCVALLACAALWASCSAPRADGHVLYLESDGYGCGAEAGLGCGLALAPVLAALDEVDGVLASGASWDGRYIRIELRSGADGTRVLAAAAELLEGDERRVDASQVPEAGDGAWYGAGRTPELSRHEAGVIAARFARDIEAVVALDAEAKRRLEAELRTGFERAFERAHAAGGGVERLWEQMPRARAEFEQRLTFLSAEQRAGIATWLDQAFEG